MTGTSITLAGEELLLCPERALYWPRRRMLLIADPHFGKAASFRALGVHAPKGTTHAATSQINALLDGLEVEHLVFLGDFLHAREGRNAETFDALTTWRASHSAVEMTIVRGNHDKRAGDPPGSVGITCVDGPLCIEPFALAHHPVAVAGHYVLAGHIHPCAVLRGSARQRERLPCFWFQENVGVLPAFGEFTGCAEIDASPDDQVWVVADESVVKIYG